MVIGWWTTFVGSSESRLFFVVTVMVVRSKRGTSSRGSRSSAAQWHQPAEPRSWVMGGAIEAPRRRQSYTLRNPSAGTAQIGRRPHVLMRLHNFGPGTIGHEPTADARRGCVAELLLDPDAPILRAGSASVRDPVLALRYLNAA